MLLGRCTSSQMSFAIVFPPYGCTELPAPRKIGGDHRVAFREQRHQQQPHMACFGVAVEPEDRRPLSS
jgi:hypothetical protein